MPRGSSAMNRRTLHEQIQQMQRAGKSAAEIATLLSITPLTIRYLAQLFQASDILQPPARLSSGQQRPELAHEMRKAGKSLVEISEMMQVSTVRVRQLVHRHAWSLRRL